MVVGVRAIERCVGGQTNDGGIGSERRTGIVNVIETVEVRDVRRPQSEYSWNRLRDPWRNPGENRATPTPGHAIRGAQNGQIPADGSPGVRAEREVGVVLADHTGIAHGINRSGEMVVAED